MKRLLAVMAMLCLLYSCKPLDVEGEVIDERMEPIAGATVQHLRTKTTVTANEKGAFYLTNLHINDTIIITAAGYKIATEVFSHPNRGMMAVVLQKE